MPVGIQDPARALLVTAAEVRNFTGFNSDRDAEDTDIELIIRSVQSTIIGSLTRHVVDLRLEGDVNGENTRYAIPGSNSARVIFDDDLAPGVVSTDALVQGVTRDSNTLPSYTTLNIASIDAVNGILTLDAAPEDYDEVIFTGRLTTRRLDKEALKTAILCQAALLVDARVREQGKVNLTNPAAQKKSGNGSSGRRGIWEDLLERVMKQLRATVPKKAGVKTSLPADTDTVRTFP